MRSPVTHIPSFTPIQRRIALGLSLVLVATAVVAAGVLVMSPGSEPEQRVLTGAPEKTTTTTSPSSKDHGSEPGDSRVDPTGRADAGDGWPSPAGQDRPGGGPDTGPLTFPPPHDNTPGVEPGQPLSSPLTHDPAAAGVPSDYHVSGVPAPAPHDPGLGYSVGTGCAAKCITGGVAHANGPGADIEVTTGTPARIWIVVWNDLDDFMEDSGSLTTSFSATFGELQPDTTYHAMAVAQDANGYSDHAYGTFQTLERKIKVSFDSGALLSAPSGTSSQTLDIDVWLNGEHRPDAWDEGIAPFGGIHDTVDLRLRVVAHHPQGQCWGQPPSGSSSLPTSHGSSTGCYTWVMLAGWDASGQVDPVSVLHDEAVVETATYRKVERTLTVNPNHSSELDAVVHMTVEIVYV